MNNKISLTFTPEKFSDFLKKLKDLSSIDNCIKIKIQRDTLLMYTIKSEKSTIVALKSYSLKTSDYFDFDHDFVLDYVICNSVKFVKSLSIFMIGDTIENDVKVNLIYRKDAESMVVISGLFSSNKLKITCIGSEITEIRDVNQEFLEEKLDPDYAEWNFSVKKSDLTNIKKLSSIYSTDDSVFDITIESGIVTFSEKSRWELSVSESTDMDYHKLTFVKKYLSNIDDTKDDIVFYVYDLFILIKDDNSNLMLSFEQTWED